MYIYAHVCFKTNFTEVCVSLLFMDREEKNREIKTLKTKWTKTRKIQQKLINLRKIIEKNHTCNIKVKLQSNHWEQVVTIIKPLKT